MDPSNFSKATAEMLHQMNVARVNFEGAQVEIKQKPCGEDGCPYWAWLVDTDIRDGRKVEIYRCDAKHTSIVTRLDS